MIGFEEKISELMEIKEEMKKIDVRHLWEYYAPNFPASENEISDLKSKGIFVDDEIVEFWKLCNGWQCFYQMVDLFGTTDIFSKKMDYANSILQIELGNQEEFSDGQLLPIAISRDDMDLFACVIYGENKGYIIWYAGGEIERFKSFGSFFSSMVEYCRADLQDLRCGFSAE